ncbi:MAG: hypothetical protein RL045_842 [Bacteroidota bacterium]|jgi:hypothetical protein
MLKKASQVFLFFLLIGFSASAQFIKWQEDNSSSFLRLNLNTHEISRFNPKTGWVRLDTLQTVQVDFHDLMPTSEGVHEFRVNKTSTYYLTIHCTGQVYLLDKSNWTLKRLDKTFYRGANCKNSVFMRGDDLYSFGGYGFWRTSNALTKYDFIGGEWLSIGADGDVPASIFDGLFGYAPKKDRFYVLSTVEMNDTEKKTAFNRDFGMYEFDFFNQKFSRVGEVKLQVVRDFLDTKAVKHFLFTGRYFIIPDKPNQSFTYDTMLIIDVEDDFKVYQWTNPHRIFLNSHGGEEVETYMRVRGDSLIWSSQYERTLKREQSFSHLLISEVLAESTYVGTLDQSPWYEKFSLVLLSAAVLVFLILALQVYRSLKRNKLKKSIRFMLGANERLFLDFLILNYEQGFVNGHQIIAFFGKHKSSPESQRQFRAKLIENFTKMLGLIFVDQEILDIQLDEQDQRMFTYRLQPEAYRKLKGL